MGDQLDVAVTEPGPFGLSVARTCRIAPSARFGKEMETWRDACRSDMLLRSAWEETSLSAPGGPGRSTTGAAATRSAASRCRCELFLRYGAWFGERFVPGRDPNDVAHVELNGRATASRRRRRESRRADARDGRRRDALRRRPPPFQSPSANRRHAAIGPRRLRALRGRRVPWSAAGRRPRDAGPRGRGREVELGALAGALVRRPRAAPPAGRSGSGCTSSRTRPSATGRRR